MMALIMGEKEKIAVEMNEKIYVAVSKEWKACKSMLEWVLDNLRGRSLCLVHVHEPAQFTTLFGLKFPISSLAEEEAIAHQEKIKQDMLLFLDECIRICSQAQVRVEKLYVESESVENGLLELITQHKIERLVMGAAADKSYSKKMKEPISKKANYVRQHAPAFCHIWFICKGHLIYTRESVKQSWLNDEDQDLQANAKSRLTQFTSDLSTSPSMLDYEGCSDRSSAFSLSQLSLIYHPSEATTDSTFYTTGAIDRESSFQPLTLLPESEGEQYHVENATRSSQLSRYHMPNAKSRLSRLSSDFSSFSSKVGSEGSSRLSTDFSTFSSKVGSELSDKSSQFSIFSQSSKAATDSTFSHSGTEDGEPSVWSRSLTPKTEGMQHHLVSPKVLQVGNINDALYSQLEQAILEATNAKKAALEELLMRRKAEKDAIDALNKAEAAKNLYLEELRRRRELEEELAKAYGTRRSQKHKAQHGPRTTPDHYGSQVAAEASS